MDALNSLANSLLVSGPQDLGLATFFAGTALAASCGLVVATIFYFRDRQRADVNTFAMSLVLFAVFCCAITLIIGSNIARGFGLVGALSIVRFRNSVRSVDDIVFLFWSLCVGMSIGAGFFLFGALFTLVTAGLYYLLSRWIFRERESLSAHVAFRVAKSADLKGSLKAIESAFRQSRIRFTRDRNLSTIESDSVRLFYVLKVPLETGLMGTLEKISALPDVAIERTASLGDLKF